MGCLKRRRGAGTSTGRMFAGKGAEIPTKQGRACLEKERTRRGEKKSESGAIRLSDPTNAPRDVQVPAPSLKAGQNAGMYAVFQGASTNVNERTSQTRETLEMVTMHPCSTRVSESCARVVQVGLDGQDRQDERRTVLLLQSSANILLIETLESVHVIPVWLCEDIRDQTCMSSR